MAFTTHIRASAAFFAAALAMVVPGTAHAGRAMDKPELKLVKAINGMRAAHGLPKLRPHRSLARAAEDHSQDMASNGFFAHNSYNGTDAHSRVMRYVNKRWMGEALAYKPIRGNTRARHILKLWMQSDGHRQTLMTRRFRRIGVGRTRGRLNGQKVVLWTADLTSAR